MVGLPLRFVVRLVAVQLSMPMLRFLAGGLTWLASGLALAALTSVVGFFLLASSVPDPSPLYRYRPVVASEISDQAGQTMFRLSHEYRLFAPYQDMPNHLIYAFLVAEDQRFFEHSGVDGVSLLRAAAANVQRSFQKQRALGGSTITQQVSKMYVGSERTFLRKLREAIFAAKLEQRLSKQKILEIYLNEVFFGVNTYGVGAAAERYFGKKIQDLTLSEAAFLAALPKGPNNYHPLRHPEAAKERRDWVLARMAEAGIISELDAQFAVSQPLPQTIHYGLRGTPTTYFDLEVKRELEQRFGESALYSQGLRVRSSLDPELQSLAEMSLQEHIIALDIKAGFRGPIQQFDLSLPGWDREFLDLQLAQVFEGWQPALVVKANAERAVLVFKSGARGLMRLEDMAWARPYRFGQKPGAYPQRVDQALQAGDVIWVEAHEDRQAEGEIKHPQIDQPTLGNPSMLLAALSQPQGAEPGLSDEQLKRYRLRQLPILSGAALVMDTRTAQIKALVGGISPKLSHFNRATQAMRQPGSTIKPFVALAALEQGLRPSSKLQDNKLTISLAGSPDWSPQNYDRKFWGSISLSKALTYSRNVPMVRLYQKLGMKPISQTMQGLGLYDAPLHNPSAVLGANETSLMRLAAAYAAVANDGIYREPTTLSQVEDADGLLLFNAQEGDREQCLMSAFCQALEAREVASAKSAGDLRAMLRSVMTDGTGRSTQAKVPHALMGKTGTSNAARDAWFIGFDQHTLVAVFVGYDTPESLGDKATGGGIAGPIFANIFKSMRAWQSGQFSIAMTARGFRVGRSFDAQTEVALAELGRSQQGTSGPSKPREQAQARPKSMPKSKPKVQAAPQGQQANLPSANQVEAGGHLAAGHGLYDPGQQQGTLPGGLQAGYGSYLAPPPPLPNGGYVVPAPGYAPLPTLVYPGSMVVQQPIFGQPQYGQPQYGQPLFWPTR